MSQAIAQIQAAVDTIKRILPDWVKFPEELQDINPFKYHLRAEGYPEGAADEARERVEKHLAGDQARIHQQEAYSLELREPLRIVRSFAAKHGIDATPLTCLVEWGELDKHRDALLVLIRVEVALGSAESLPPESKPVLAKDVPPAFREEGLPNGLILTGGYLKNSHWAIAPDQIRKHYKGSDILTYRIGPVTDHKDQQPRAGKGYVYKYVEIKKLRNHLSLIETSRKSADLPVRRPVATTAKITDEGRAARIEAHKTRIEAELALARNWSARAGSQRGH